MSIPTIKPKTYVYVFGSGTAEHPYNCAFTFSSKDINIDMTNMSELVEPAILLLSLSKLKPKYIDVDKFEYSSYENSKENIEPNYSPNLYYKAPTNRPIRNVNSIYARNKSPISMEYTNTKNQKTSINRNINRHTRQFDIDNRVLILKNFNDYKYYGYEGVVTFTGNGFYTVKIDETGEEQRFRGNELKLID
jgi:hypothetical protein